MNDFKNECFYIIFGWFCQKLDSFVLDLNDFKYLYFDKKNTQKKKSYNIGRQIVIDKMFSIAAKYLALMFEL